MDVRGGWTKLLISTSFVFALSDAGADPCPKCEVRECETYRVMLPYSSLGAQAAEIGIRALDSAGGMNRDQAWREAYQLKLSTDTIIPEKCKKVFLAEVNSKYEFYSRTRAETKPSDSIDMYDTLTAAHLAVNHYNYLLAEMTNCKDPISGTINWANFDWALEKSYQECLAKNGPAASDRLSKLLSTDNPINLPESEKKMGDQERKILRAYNDLLAIGQNDSPDGRKALEYLKKNKGKFNTAEKLLLVSMFGRTFNVGYDQARFDETFSSGSVGLGSVMGAASANSRNQSIVRDNRNALNEMYFTERGLPFDPATNSFNSGLQYAGVCRDIASAQGQMLEALGFKNTYVVSYANTGGSVLYHATVITQDPDQKRLYKFNYDLPSMTNAQDSRALNQGDGDISLNYRVFKPGGRHSVTVQSEFGKFMTEAAGFDVVDMSRMSRPADNVLAMRRTIGDSGKLTLQTGVGADSFGMQYVFAGTTYRYGTGTRFPGGVGLVLGTQHRPLPEIYDRESTNLDFLYVQFQQRFATNGFRLSSNVNAKIEALATAILMGGVVRETGDVTLQGDLRVSAGVRVDQGKPTDRVSSTYGINVQVAPGIGDVRNARSIPLLYMNQMLFSAEGRLRLSQSPEGRAYLIAATTVMLDDLGIRGRSELGVASDKFAAILQVEGNITEGSALFIDGAERKSRANFTWTPNKVVRVSAYAEVSSDFEAGADAAVKF